MKNSEILKQIITSRRSIFPKEYSEIPIPKEILDEILNSAVLAPNHKRTKPWRFKIFENNEKLELGKELQQIYKKITPDFQFLQKKYDDILFKTEKAGAIITIVVEFSELVPEWEEIAATAMAVQNMYLTCTAHQIGCYWSSPKLVNYLEKAVQIQENQQCLGLFYMGQL